MSHPAIRIAVSGLPGTGKSTLAAALGAHYGVPILAENMLTLANAARDFDLATEGRDDAEIQRRGAAMANAFLDWQRDRQTALSTTSGFIADRWDVDLLDWWLVMFAQGNRDVDAITRQLIEGFVASSEGLTLAVVTPIVPPFATGTNDEGNGRLVNLTKHVTTNSLMVGLCRRFTSVPVFELPPVPMTVDERVRAVVEVVESRS